MPSTRILSWEQMCREAEGPDYTRRSLQPWVYEFSNGRIFIDHLPLYSAYAIVETFDVGLENGTGDLALQSGGRFLLESAV